MRSILTRSRASSTVGTAYPGLEPGYCLSEGEKRLFARLAGPTPAGRLPQILTRGERHPLCDHQKQADDAGRVPGAAENLKKKPLNRPTAITSSCAPSSPAGPASSAQTLQTHSHLTVLLLHSCGPSHLAQNHDVVIIDNLARPAGEHRAPPRPPPGIVHRREHQRSRPPDGDLPGHG